MSTDVAEFVSAVQDAVRQAGIDHDSGRCHLSEWSCSYCEAAGIERVRVGGVWARVVRDLEQLRTLPIWCLRWNEALGAWLYLPAPSADSAR